MASKVVPVEKSLFHLNKLIRDKGYPQKSFGVLKAYIDSFPKVITDDGQEAIRLDQYKSLIDSHNKALLNRDPAFWVTKRGFKDGRIVDPIEFVENKEFNVNVKAWPSVKDNLCQIFDPDKKRFEIILTGSIRGGKSVTCQLAIEYIAYLLSRLHNPHFEFGLSPGRSLLIVLQSVNQDKAGSVLFEPIKNDLDASPYFQKNFNRNTDRNGSVILPSNIKIVPLTANETAALGENIFSAVLTEPNFMRVIKGSVKLRHSNKVEYDQAKEMYNRLHERITATFPVNDWYYFGKLIADSSVNHPHDFSHQKMEQAKNDPGILVINRPIWEAQPPDKFPPNEPRFLVEVGDNHRFSRIIDSRDDALHPESVIRVPEKLRIHFEQDIEEALKNYAGVVTALTGAFIPFTDEITRAQTDYLLTTDNQTLFLREELSTDELLRLSEPGQPIDWSHLINYEYIKGQILDPNAVFSMHFDLSASGDATGFCIGRIIQYTAVEQSDSLDEDFQSFRDPNSRIILPVFMIDGTLRFISRSGQGEIDPSVVTRLGLELKKHLNIRYGSSDTWGSSRSILLEWSKRGISTKFISVDKDLLAYTDLKQAIRDGRILFQPNSILDTELREIRKVVKSSGATVDHSQDGSKDISDAFAAVVHVLSFYEARRGLRLATREGRRKYGPQESISHRDGREQIASNRHSPLGRSQRALRFVSGQ
jgi:hypothetical protein